MRLNRIHQIALYARDLEEAIAFYRDTLGASYLGKFDPPGLAFAGTFGKPGNEEWMAFFRDPSDNVLALATQ